MKQLKDTPPLVGARISTGIHALDKLLGCNRDAPDVHGFHVPSIVLLTGAPGVGKTTLLHEMIGLWGLPSLCFTGTATPISVLRMVANSELTAPANLLIVDDANYLGQKSNVNDLWSENRLVILVMHAAKRQQLIHDVGVHMHMERNKKRRVNIGTTISCKEKNRFGQTGEIFRLTGSQIWRSE